MAQKYRKTLIEYAAMLYRLSLETNQADDRPKYQARLAALVPMFLNVFGNGTENELRKLVQNEIHRDGWDFFPTAEVEARLLAPVQKAFFELFK